MATSSPAGAESPAAPAKRVWLTELIKGQLLDRTGDRLGRVDDVIVRLAEGAHPPVTGLVGRIGGRQLFVPRDRLADLEPGVVHLTGETLNLARFERRQGEVLLRQDVLDRRLIRVSTGRLINAHDIELTRNADWHVAGVDVSPRGVVRRLLPMSMRSHGDEPRTFVDWQDVEPFVGHVPTSRLLMPLRRLRTLHPAQIADIVEQASHDEGEEIISAVHQDPELEADVFEELDSEHQVEFLRDRSDEEVAAVLAEMGADDAADLITELDQERRLHVLQLLPPAKQAKVRALLGYNSDSAGGLMTTDFIAVPQDATVSEAIAAVRAADLPEQVASDVFVTDPEQRLAGSVPLVALVQSGDGQRISELVEPDRTALHPDDDFPQVALAMADFNLVCAPVIDDDGRILGVITVDDVLEQMMPDAWRRRAEAEGD
jgi:CBS domain-containing protein